MVKEKKINVKVYSTTQCPWCYKLKDWLKANKIAFEDIDVGKDMKMAREMIKKSGQMGVPVTEINGEIVVGFDIARLKKLLKVKE